MTIIPIQVETGNGKNNTFTSRFNAANDRRGSIDRRGSYTRLINADPILARRGSYARVLADVSNRRRGSAAKINPVLSDGGLRRDSYAKINIDLAGSRRGSLLRRDSKQDIKLRRISQTKLIGDDKLAAAASRRGSLLDGGSRRGSLLGGGAGGGTGRRGSDARFEGLLARRGSGLAARAAGRRGSRPQIKSFQIKIKVEEDSAPTTKSNLKRSTEANKENKREAVKSRMEANKKIPVTNRATDKDKNKITRWQDVDREVLHYRGDGAGIEVQPAYSRNKLGQSQPGKKVEKSAPVCTPEFLAQFAKEALDQHNKYRSIHGVQPLVLDDKLSDHAQKYAKHLAKTATFEHSNDPDYGENLYWSWSSDPNFKVKGEESVDSWYEECLQSYDYSREPTDTESGHFTQMVWDTTRRLGVGLAKSSTGRNIVVMKYDPPGNYVGEYTKHVHKPVNNLTPPAAGQL